MNKLITYILTLIIVNLFNQMLCMKVDYQLMNDTGEENYLSHPEVDVLILGAGYAGAAAALRLHEKKINNFLVLEAKDYIGGRVKEERFGDKTIPIGAGWIHHIERGDNVIARLARKYKLTTYNDTYSFDKISFRHGEFGYRFNKWYVKTNDRIMRTSLDRCQEYAEAKVRTGEMEMSLRDCLQWAGWDIHSFKNEKMRESIDYFMFDFENAGRPEDLSAWQISYTGEGTDVIVTDPRGYSYPLFEEIKPFRNKFHLNTEVASITRSRNRKYTIKTSNHKTYRAKHVIVTFSSGVLLAGSVKFTPQLPPWKMEALHKVPMGHYCKFFFQFPYQFWEDSTYIVLATKVRGNYAHWQNMNKAHLFPGSNILLCTITGQMCKEKHTLPDDVIIKEAMKILRIQRPYVNAPDPIALKRNSWSTDPHVMGAYSLPTAGITEHDYAVLEHPLHQRLWFSGEYADVADFGYTYGAYYHGQKTADRLIKCMKQRRCPGERPK